LLLWLCSESEFQNLKVGITDYSNSSASREFIEVFDQSDAFVISQYRLRTSNDRWRRVRLRLALLSLRICGGIACGRTAQVQALYDAVDANTALPQLYQPISQ